MASKSNMDRAKREERWFWVAAVTSICILAYLIFVVLPAGVAGRGEGLFLGAFMLTGVMAGCVFRLTRAYKREIADLKSGEAAGSFGESPAAPDSVDDSADIQGSE
ncbi:MAG: hypothetical protein QF363_21460 [Planctomycetaceae bacterium]|jgi:hypothetical protein|nr:hypothetical protein [Planctomycetaceae bacterium]